MMIRFPRLVLLAPAVLALNEGCILIDFDTDPNGNPISDRTNIDKTYAFTDSNGNVVESVVLGCFRPVFVTDYYSCYTYPPPSAYCDSGSNLNPSKCTPGDAYASNPVWSQHGGVAAHSGQNVFGIGLPCFGCQYVLLNEGTVGGGQVSFTPTPVQQVSIWMLASQQGNGTSWTNYAYLYAYDSNGQQLDQNQVRFTPQSRSDFGNWHQLTYTSTSNNIAFARFSSVDLSTNNAVPFSSEFDDLCVATDLTTVGTPFGNFSTGCDPHARLPPAPKPAPSASLGAPPGGKPDSVFDFEDHQALLAGAR